MERWLVRVEGVNFDATLFETNDLSTLRGASLGLLGLVDPVKDALTALDGLSDVDILFEGASQCALFVSSTLGEETPARARAAISQRLSEKGEPGRAPHAYLTTVIDVVPVAEGDGEGTAALVQAEARNRSRQYRQWTLEPLPFTRTAKDVGEFERGRPGTVEWTPPKGKGRPVLLPPPETPPETQPAPKETKVTKYLSDAVDAKRAHGRLNRQNFYIQAFDGDGETINRGKAILWPGAVPGTNDKRDMLFFTDSLNHMVTDEPDGLPPSTVNKVAVIYADGNGFTGIRGQVGISDFARDLKAKRLTLLEAVLHWLAAGARSDDRTTRSLFSLVDKRTGKRGLRFETLLWGGDELMFVMPCWLAFPFLTLFDRITRNWAMKGISLTHALGVTIADRRTPIRQLTAIAKTAADLAKEAGGRGRSTVTVDVFESVVPPDEPHALTGIRREGLGGPTGKDGDKALTEMLALPLAGIAPMMAEFARFKGIDEGKTGYPRSQIYAALRAAKALGARPLDRGGAGAMEESLKTHAKRVGWPKTAPSPLNDFPAPLADWTLGQKLVFLSIYWDYIHPGGHPLPGLGLEGEA